MGILNNILKNEDNEVKEEAVNEAPVSKKEPGRPGKKVQDPSIYKIISHPLISEKATELALLNKYVFVVPVEASKAQIKEKIKNLYGVEPKKINVISKEGKTVRYGRTYGQKKSFKKAIITLAAGEKIEVYEGV